MPTKRLIYRSICRRSVVVVQDWGDQAGGLDWFIQNAYTEPEARGQGLMRELMSRVIKNADALEATLFLDVGGDEDTPEWEALREWYERLGFVQYAPGRRMVRERRCPADAIDVL